MGIRAFFDHEFILDNILSIHSQPVITLVNIHLRAGLNTQPGDLEGEVIGWDLVDKLLAYESWDFRPGVRPIMFLNRPCISA